MLKRPYNYSIFFDFVESYLPTGFQNIHADDPIMQKLEEVMEENDQFFSMADLGKMQFIYNSKRSEQMMGIAPKEFHPGHFQEAVHPDDFERFGLARSLVYRIERDIFRTSKGSKVLSANFLMKNPAGTYTNLLFQCYIFYSPLPSKTIFDLQLYTNIDSFNFKKNSFHHYLGNDLSFFRFPDENLLKIGPVISAREFEIVRLIELGLSSKQIADKLFLSVFTVNTHRSNILEKSGKAGISDLIYELKEQGLL
ncbi:MAG: LuxR C-terminal-related transcriptional regulator [Lentimicrobium sp.]